MPLTEGAQALTTTTIPSPPVLGMPWEVWLIVLAVVLPFLFAVGVSIAAYIWMRGKMSLDRYIKIFDNGDVKIGDMKPQLRAITMKDEKHVLAKGKPKLFLRSRFGWRQPLHFFEQGSSMELDVAGKKFHSGKDNENSEYLKAYVDTERAKQIFTLSLNLGFSVLLAIAAASVGILIGMGIAHFTATPAAAPAVNATVTTIAGMIKK
jgi:hypothetical protein